VCVWVSVSFALHFHASNLWTCPRRFNIWFVH